MPRPRRSPEARTGARILLRAVPTPAPPEAEVEGDCWLWPTAMPNGYAKMSLDSRYGYVHRIAYEIFVGPIPEGLTIDHLCRVTRCCNPAHLEPVTIRENLLRSPRTRTSINASRTRCPKGHPYDEANTHYQKRDGGRRVQRVCRACRRVDARERRAAA